ncbi:MAG: holo-[acyl-carrier protein] synthase [Chloroflexi bacterium]|nr:MAG: holo-[acyl-carrier protein] synthase [Chloroflexota bacterium]
MNTVGIDIIEIDRIASVIDRWGARFLNRIYTKKELDYCRGRFPQLAARFAAKEAVMKALGTGVRGVGWRDVEVTRQRGDRPKVELHGRAAMVAVKTAVIHIALSISHSRKYAVASVSIDSKNPL